MATERQELGTAQFVDSDRTKDDQRSRGGVVEERHLPDEQDDRDMPLVDSGTADSFRGRWSEIQTQFVDEPRESVKQADELVAGLIRQLASQFANERSRLESHWDRGEEVSTEDLRIALQRYRSFFDRLLRV